MSRQPNQLDQADQTHPISRRVRNIPIPVNDVEKAREWYRRVLGMDVGPVNFGHLCGIKMDNGTDILLDANGAENVVKGQHPLLMFLAPDIHAAHEHLRNEGVEIVEVNGQAILNNTFFLFKDPDVNLLVAVSN